MIEINWNIFKEKFNGREHKEFESLCYQLFCSEFNKDSGIFRYKNQVGIETEPIIHNGKSIGFQSKYYETKISDNKKYLIDAITKAKRKNQNLDRILFYLNKEFSESSKKHDKEPKYKKEIENHAKSLKVEIEWRVPSHLERQLSLDKNKPIAQYFFSFEKSVIDFDENKYLDKILNKDISNTISLFIESIDKIKNIPRNNGEENLNDDKKTNLIKRTDSLFNNIELKTINFLIGIGGSGKTTTCMRIIKKLASLRKYDKEFPLPVFLECSDFKDNLSTMIQTELNIKSGTWKSMPNSFIFIMDGLNEISYDKQKSLIKELEKLLEDYPIEILITTRDGKILNNIVIKNFNAGFNIIPLSNIGIRKISKILLPESDIENFISEYISKFNTNRLFRTPFLVSKAIEVFKTNQPLPNKIGKLIELYFQKRIVRNNELTTENIIIIGNYKIIAELLSELAFKHKVENKVKYFTINELNQAITEAKENGNLNILNDYSISDIIKLLLDYEIIITDENKYEFEHDIVADYFAAKKLAKYWRNYINTIDYEQFKDIWSFSAEEIIENDYKEFIGSIASKDLILASECVKNMKQSANKHIDRFIMESYHKNTQFADYQSTIAMVFIGKDKYQNFLRNEFNKKNISESKKHSVKTALLKLGNEDIINEILNEAEKMDFLPFQTSGGAKELWKSVPYNLQIKLARKRIKKSLGLLKTDKNIPLHKQNFSFSIQTIIYNGGSSKDIKLMKRILEEIKEYKPCFYAFFCILFHDFENSKESLLEKRKIFGLNERLEITKNAFDEGYNLIEVRDDLQLINLLKKSIVFKKQLKELTNNDNNKIKYKVKDLTIKESKLNNILSNFSTNNLEKLAKNSFELLKRIELCDDAKKMLVAILTENQLIQAKNYFWEIAAKYDIEEVNKLVVDILKRNDLSRIARTADYVLLANWIKNKIEDFTSEIIKIVNANRDKWFELDFFRLINYLAINKAIEPISELLNLKLKQLFSNKKLSNIDFKKLKNKHNVNLNNELERITVRYLIVASKIPDFIEKGVIYLSFRFKESDYYSEMEEVYSSFLQHLTEEEIDNSLSERTLYNKNFLEALSKLPKTDKRIKCFINKFNKAARIDLYKELITKYWCKDVAKFIVSRFIAAKEPDNNSITFYESLNDLFSKDQAEVYIKPMLQKKLSDNQNRILQFWYDCAINKKKFSIT